MALRWRSVVVLLTSLYAGVVLGRDYCLDEIFEVTCQQDEIIMIRSAVYGRMEFGQCVRSDYGFVGCSGDVVDVLAGKCSGRRHCKIVNFETTFASRNECPPDLKSYLEAEYSCEKVAVDPGGHCASDGMIRLTDDTGLLSSTSTLDNGWGNRYCPWILEAQPGQRLKLTLYDYTDYESEEEQDAKGAQELDGEKVNTADADAEYPLHCKEYFVLTDASFVKNMVSCVHDHSPKPVYVSTTNRLEVMVADLAAAPHVTFVIKYEVIGCPAVTIPRYAHVYKQEDDILVLKCNYSSQSWRMRCAERQWVGERRNCSNGVPLDESLTARDSNIPLGLSIVVIAGVALLICLTVLLFGLLVIYIRRRCSYKNRRRDEREFVTFCHSVENEAKNPPPDPYRPQARHASLERTRVAYSPMSRTMRVPIGRAGPEGDYAHIWELKEPIPVCTPTVPHGVNSRTTTLTATSTLSAKQSTVPQATDVECKTLDRSEPRALITFKPGDEQQRLLAPHFYESPQFRCQAPGPGSHSATHCTEFYIDVELPKKSTNHYST